MSKLFSIRKASQYLFFEMWPPLIIGVLVFVFIMVMVQAIHFTEFVLIHGVSLWVVTEMMFYICISFLPALLPMALLFAVLMTYGRLSQDSEIMALKAAGYNQWQIMTPAMVLSVLVSLVSANTSFHMAPWGNRQFEILISQLEQTKASATIREGTFSEGFFDLVVYANEVNTKTGVLKKIFIYDERDGDIPLTIIAKDGKIVQDPKFAGRAAFVRLLDGEIHRQSETHTKIKFSSFDVRLADMSSNNMRAKTPPSLSIEEISEHLKEPNLTIDDRRDLEVEFHKRWAFSLVCIVFAALGVGFGTAANSRNQKGTGFIMSLLVVVGYWILYVAAESTARSGHVPVALALWIPNTCFAGLAIYRLRKIWN